MGKKLEFLDQLESHRSIQEYEEKYDTVSKRNVKVTRNNGIIFKSQNVDVVIGHSTYGTDLRQVNIDWEKAGFEEYRDFNLYGIYSSVYCKIEYTYDTLIIHTDNRIKIEID